MEATEADRETTAHCSGLYVGLLTADEMESFNRCIQDGYAIRKYDDYGLGLAKVAIK